MMDPRLDMTFKVECTRLTYLLTLLSLLCGGTFPGVPWSGQARAPCSLTVAERRYLPSSVHRGIHVVVPSERCTTASLSCAPLRSTALSVTFTQQRIVLGKSLMIATPSFTVRSRLFGLGTALSTLLSLVVVSGNRCRSGGWHIVHGAARLATCLSVFLVASSQSHLVVLCAARAPVCSRLLLSNRGST